MNPLLHRVRTVLDALTRPHASFNTAIDRQKARYAAAMLLVLIGTVLLTAPMMLLIEGMTAAYIGLLALTLSLLLAYVLNRYGRYRTAIGLLIVMVSLFSFALILRYPEAQSVTSLLPPIFIASLFLSLRKMLATALLLFLALFTLIALVPGDWSGWPQLLLFLVIMTLLVMVSRSLRDWSEQRLMENNAALAASEARLRSLVEGSPASALLLEVVRDAVGQPNDFVVREASRKAGDWLPCKTLQVIGQRYSHLQEDDKLSGAPLTLVLDVWRERTAQTHEVSAADQDLEYHLVPLDDLLVLSVRDVTTRKREEVQQLALIKEQQRVLVLHDFILAASHDLNTPLSNLSTGLYLLGRKENLSEDGKQRLAKMDGHLNRLKRIVEDMLSLSRLDAERYVTLNPTNLSTMLIALAEATEMQASVLGLTLNTDIPNDLPTLFTHPDLPRALKEVLNNAVQFTPSGGQIGLSARRNGTDVYVTVQDTGLGIAEDELPFVFDRFYRGAQHRPQDGGGSGLGLSIAQKILEFSGGSIMLNSKVGAGTEVTLRLPLNMLDANS